MFDVNVTDYNSEFSTILTHVHKIGTFIPNPGTTKLPIGVATQAVQVSKNMLLARIYKLWTEIQEIEDSIEPYAEPKRSRRGTINAAGSVVKFLFGNPDNRDLEELPAKLEKISAEQEKFVTVLKAEATVVNTIF